MQEIGEIHFYKGIVPFLHWLRILFRLSRNFLSFVGPHGRVDAPPLYIILFSALEVLTHRSFAIPLSPISHDHLILNFCQHIRAHIRLLRYNLPSNLAFMSSLHFIYILPCFHSVHCSLGQDVHRNLSDKAENCVIVRRSCRALLSYIRKNSQRMRSNDQIDYGRML